MINIYIYTCVQSRCPLGLCGGITCRWSSLANWTRHLRSTPSYVSATAAMAMSKGTKKSKYISPISCHEDFYILNCPIAKCPFFSSMIWNSSRGYYNVPDLIWWKKENIIGAHARKAACYGTACYNGDALWEVSQQQIIIVYIYFHWRPPDPSINPIFDYLIDYAVSLGTVSAFLQQVPNQPITFPVSF